MTGTIAPNIPTKGDALGTSDKKTRESLTTLRDAHNELLTSENKIGGPLSPVNWYAPKSIATEESRENTSFGTLATPDEIKGVVLPANGLIMVYLGVSVKSSVAAAGRVTVKLGANQLADGRNVEITNSTVGTTFSRIMSNGSGLLTAESEASWPATGQVLGSNVGGGGSGGPIFIFAAAGTYDVSIQYRATSGKITARERKLWVATLGV